VKLDVMKREGLGPKTRLRGRVVDKDGNPVVGAKIDPEGVQRGTGTRWGGLDGIDPLAITDENGAFLITSKEPFDGLNVVVEARGLARLRRNGLAPDQEHVITLTDGALVTGRVLFNGKPLRDVTIGMAGANRLAGEFVGSFEMATGNDGRFLIPALPPDTDYYLYGLMSSLKDYGAIPARQMRTKGDGIATDVGELNVVAALRLGGELRLSDGRTPPAQTRVTVGFDDAWDTQYTEVDPTGRFELRGIPPHAVVSVSTRVNGYRFSGRNASLDPWNPFHLIGRLDEDKTNLVVLLEPGKNLEPGRDFSPEDHPKNRALNGAETLKDLSDQVIISGRVVDAETQERIPVFQITPGRGNSPSRRGPNRVAWESHRTELHTNGAYTLMIPKGSRPLVLLSEAEGYLPAASPLLSGSQTNYDFALKRGSGPRGTVLLPKGEPAAGASVIFGSAGDQFALFPDGRMTSFRNRQSETKADAQGAFAFAARLEGGRIFAATEQGFAECSVEELTKSSKIMLQPWGSIKGRLVQAGKPVTNETVAVTVASEFNPDQPHVNLQHRVATDSNGAFEFQHVPPGKMQIVTLVPMGAEGLSRGWTHQLQATVNVVPGATETVEVEKKSGGRPELNGFRRLSEKPGSKP
jgi:uncharacterized GH25 family protein